MLDGKPTIVVSHSVGFQDKVAKPVAERLQLYGVRAVLVGEEPLPLGTEWECTRDKRYGATAVAFLRAKQNPAPASTP